MMLFYISLHGVYSLSPMFQKSPYERCLGFSRNIMSGLLFIFHGGFNTEIVLVLFIGFTLCVQ